MCYKNEIKIPRSSEVKPNWKFLWFFEILLLFFRIFMPFMPRKIVYWLGWRRIGRRIVDISELKIYRSFNILQINKEHQKNCLSNMPKTYKAIHSRSQPFIIYLSYLLLFFLHLLILALPEAINLLLSFMLNSLQVLRGGLDTLDLDGQCLVGCQQNFMACFYLWFGQHFLMCCNSLRFYFMQH